MQERLKEWHPEAEAAWRLGFPGRHVESYRKVPLQALKGHKLERLGRVHSDWMPMQEARGVYGTLLDNRRKARALREESFFAALTESVYEDGYFLYVPPNTVQEVDLRLVGSGDMAHTHVQIFVGRGANVVIKAHPTSEGILSQVVDLYLDKRATLTWSETTSLLYMNAVRATVKEGGRLEYISDTKGSPFFRQEFRVELIEPHAEAVLLGASDLQGTVSHTEVRMEHRAPDTKSRQHFKAVLREKSLATFEGKIFVAPEAQKTEAYQLNNSLMIDQEGEVFTKPNLEIFADDVKASHGATVAQFSEEELFYFQTRGMNRKMAGTFLAKGFLDEVRRGV